MKKKLLCVLLYAILIAMITESVLVPGNIIKKQPVYFHYIFIIMVIMSVLWVTRSTFYMFIAPWYMYIWERRKRYFALRRYRPLVSIIIPAWNEEVGLVATLKTILASSYRPMEIIVINDGSTDRSDENMRVFLQKYQSNLRGLPNYVPIIYAYQKNGGKGSALNAGILRSHGEIIITFDADSIVHEDAIKHFVAYFADPDVMAAAGNIKVGNKKTFLGLIQSLEYHFGFQNKKAEALLGVVFVIGGAAGAFRKEVFEQLGGYSVGTLTEDLDLSLRIQEAGMRIVYVPEAIVHTEGPTTLHGLMKQRLRWKHGRLEAFRRHKSLFFSKKKDANKPFFWIILPLVIIGDIEIILGTAYVILLYVYSFLTYDFSILLFTIAMAALTFLLLLNDDRHFRKLAYFVLAPIAWFLFHFVTFIELASFCKALYMFYRKHEVKWQQWQRTGVIDS